MSRKISLRVSKISMPTYDVVIVGASFSGLTLAHHLPAHLRVLIVDAKPTAGATVESTGLITVRTHEELASFFPIKTYLTNPITSICVVAPDFERSFISETGAPWIYQTDTKAFVRGLAERLPANVDVWTSTLFLGVEGDPVTRVELLHEGKKMWVETRFLVGADGGRSTVATKFADLDRNTRFLFGFEQVFFGAVHLGPKPEETIYHFWFGEFSLGYGGWLSPTVVNGKPAFRVGLAKLMKDKGDAVELMRKFLKILLDRKIVTVEGDPEKPDYQFGSMIPIGGSLTKVSYQNVLLIGDAAGFCGAFAADGIKGSVVSGKEAAPLIERYLKGETGSLKEFLPAVNKHDSLISYYKRQVFYRWVWDLMKRDRSFTAMYDIVEKEKDSFLNQFCDSKDKRASLAWVVLKWRHVGRLLKYSWYLLVDLVFPPKK